MNAKYTERSRRQSRRVPGTEHPPHTLFAQPGLQQEIICMVVPRETPRCIETEQHEKLPKLKRHQKTPGSDLRRAFMANEPNKESLERFLGSSLFAGPRKQSNKQGQSETPMGKPQPRERGLLPTPTLASQRTPQGMQRTGPPASSRGPSFAQRVLNALSEELSERSQASFVPTCSAEHDEVSYWNRHNIQQHAGLGNQIHRHSGCNKAQREALFPPPPEMSSTTLTSLTSFEEDEEVQRPETRIPIGCRACERLRKRREAHEAYERELAGRTQAHGNVHNPYRNLGRSAKASMEGLWCILRDRSRWYRGLGSMLQGIHGEAQPLLMGKFQNGNQSGMVLRSKD